MKAYIVPSATRFGVRLEHIATSMIRPDPPLEARARLRFHDGEEALLLISSSGRKRYFAIAAGWIGSDLRMRIIPSPSGGYIPPDWEESDPEDEPIPAEIIARAEALEAHIGPILERIGPKLPLSHPRLSSVVFPEALVWGDRGRERGGDYARIATLSFGDARLLLMEPYRDHRRPEEYLLGMIAEADALRYRIGSRISTSMCGSSRTLGGMLSSDAAAEAEARRRERAADLLERIGQRLLGIYRSEAPPLALEPRILEGCQHRLRESLEGEEARDDG